MAPQSDSAKSAYLISRNVTVDGRRTSVRLEPQMWQALDDICRRERLSVHDICTMVAERRRAGLAAQDRQTGTPSAATASAAPSLTAALRVFILSYFRKAATEQGHQEAGHGKGSPVPSDLLAPVEPVWVRRRRGTAQA